MKTIIRKNTWLQRNIPGHPEFNMDFGWGNGYVLIPIGHKYHGVNYNDIDVSVHGGLTYGELMTKENAEFWNLDKEDVGTWCVGFDTAHCDDTLAKYPKEYVQAEADNLAKQLNGVAISE